MTDMIKEFCGVFGVSCNDYGYSVASMVYPGLMAIQHRGQIFSGISIAMNVRMVFDIEKSGHG